MNNPMIDITAHGIARKIVNEGANGTELIASKIAEWGNRGIDGSYETLQTAVVERCTLLRRDNPVTTVFVVILRSYNFDDCDSSSAVVIATRQYHADAVTAAEAHMEARGGFSIQWDSDYRFGKVDVIAEIEIVETSIN